MVLLKKEKFRLAYIDTPELRGDTLPEGRIARDWLRDYIKDKQLTIKTIKDQKGKYGRYLGILMHENININELMIELNIAKEYK